MTVERDSSSRSARSGGRALPAVAERLLIIGLDGATFDVLGPMMTAGVMPRMKEAVESGASGVLRSTVPPITPAAWTTFLTGKQPGTHGIIDFQRYDCATNRLSLNSTRCLDHIRNIWQILSDEGLRVGSVNVPMTYPPIPVNGFLVSGFETPGPEANFVYPPELKSEVLRHWPDPTLKTKWRRRTFGGDTLFEENVACMSDSFHQGAAMTTSLGDKSGWDVLMVVLKLVDNLQHKTWKHIDPRWSDRHPKRREIVLGAFRELDRAVGTLLDYAQDGGAAVMMVSDHGHGSLEGKVQPNLLLKRWGYLTLRGGGAQQLTRARLAWNRVLGKPQKAIHAGDIGHDLAVDFSKTRACVMHAGMAGFLYLNLQGRQPGGVVDPAEYEPLRDELRERFLGSECRTVDPWGKSIQLFTEVHRTEELYGCSRDDQPWLPDLLLTPHESLAVIRKIRGSNPVRWLSYRRLEGTHRSDGILIATGPGIARSSSVSADMVDCAPTILAMLGLRIPRDMEGQVITGMFERRPAIETESVESEDSGPATGEEVYSPEEQQTVIDRLMDLGYLQ
ncbi:MAG: alkaline phosphatase family protein [Phycisphaerales bacterium]|nr:MAG: alkaline phosphatase family protein [Phycisphaerales bacterium]